MDPDANLAEISRLINDHDKDPDRLAELVLAVYGWLAKGGYEPDWTKYPQAGAFWNTVILIRRIDYGEDRDD